jgi:NAD(P)-dependent dehydrogenase (short-subunit alcohol dehydrogenase family)
MSKVWLITGSSRGLGLALAKAVLARGHRLVATARRQEDLGELVGQYGDQVRAVALDVTDATAARASIATATSAFGRLDVVVNNAGYANVSSIEHMADADLREQIETNFFVHSEMATSSRSRRSAAAAAVPGSARTSRRNGPSKVSPRCSPARSRRSASA